jgi:hypothetical protein
MEESRRYILYDSTYVKFCSRQINYSEGKPVIFSAVGMGWEWAPLGSS